MKRRLLAGFTAVVVLSAAAAAAGPDGAAVAAAQTLAGAEASPSPLVPTPAAIPSEPVSPFVLPKVSMPTATAAEVVLADAPTRAGASPISVVVDRTPRPPEVPVVSSPSTSRPSASTSSSTSTSAAASATSIAATPSTIASAAPAPDAVLGGRVAVEVLDGARVRALGADGLAFRVVARDAKAAGAPLTLTVDYGSFREAFGGDWASRLQVLRWPDCVLTTPERAECAKPTVVADVVNDLGSSVLSVKVTAEASLVPPGTDKLPSVSRGAQPALGAGLAPVEAPWSIPTDERSPTPVVDESLSQPGIGKLNPTGTASPVTSPTAPFDAAPPASEQPKPDTAPVLSGGGRSVPLSSALLQGGGGSGVFGLSGAQGSYAATDLRPAQKWDVGLSSGNFSWSYPVVTPPSTAGPQAQIGLSYSSQSVDGMTSSANNQPGVAGLGWGVDAAGFIQRGYVPCTDPRIGATATDQCWLNNNATISLGGVSSELVPVEGSYNQWRLRNDNGWRVERVLNGEVGGRPHPDSQREYWVVTDQKGTKYYFGLYYDTALPTAGVTDSVWMIPVWNVTDTSGPCYGAYCAKAWRWNLDRVIDTSGNSESLYYTAEQNNYGFNGQPNVLAGYQRGGVLQRVEYGKTAAGAPRQKVEFAYSWRCVDGGYDETSCAAFQPTVGNAAHYPDTPVDLLCWGPPCSTPSPSFFTVNRLARITTFVSDGLTGWRSVDEVKLNHEWPANADGSQAKMWLRSLQHTGFAAPAGATMAANGTGGGTDPLGSDNKEWLPAVRFDSTQNLPNRYDVNVSAGVLPMNMFRLTKITDELGATTTVTYGQPHPCAGMPAAGWQANTKDCYPAYWVPPAGPAGFAIFHKYLATQVSVADTSTMGSPTRSWSYGYSDEAAWQYDDNPLAYWMSIPPLGGHLV